jgi:hypothetical protein
MERAPQAGRFAIVVVMKNWEAIALAHGLALSPHELDRVAQPLAALEETFRPLVKHLTPDLEPDLELHLSGEGE